MAAGLFTLYKANLDDLRIVDLVGATVKVALVSSAYTPNATITGHSLWSSVSGNEIANGNGYTTGGITVADDAAFQSGQSWYYSNATAISWTASGGSIPAWRYAVFYVSGTLWGKTNPLIGYFLGDATPADIPATANGQALTLGAPALGWFTVAATP